MSKRVWIAVYTTYFHGKTANISAVLVAPVQVVIISETDYVHQN